MTDSRHAHAAELHTHAAEAHKAAAAAHAKGDVHTAQALTKKAHECTSVACKHTEEIAKAALQPTKV
jgi:hypothetical protein